MTTRGYEKLAELVLESLWDDDGSVESFFDVLASTAIFQNKRAVAEADDYTPEELEWHAETARFFFKRAPSTRIRSDVADFLWALDRGYFGPTNRADLTDSAFVEKLRAVVAKPVEVR